MASMVAAWPVVALGEVMQQRKQFIQIDDMAEYKRCRVQLHAQGAVLRDIVAGSEVKTKSQQVCKPGEFLVAEIDAKVGGFGIVPPALDGAIVSSHYFLFVLDESRLNQRFLDFYIRTPSFQEQVRAQGSTNYAAVRPADVLSYTIPLPPLDEQRRIVARIEELAARIEEARRLRREAMEETKQLLPSAISGVLRTISASSERASVESVSHSVTDGDHLPPPQAESGIPFLFISNVVHGTVDFANCKWVMPEYFDNLHPSRVPRRGDILYTAVGSYGVPCLVNTDEPFCFQRHIAIIKPNRRLVLPEYLKWALASADVFDQASSYATGSAQLTVPLSAIRRLRFPLPELAEQERAVTYLNNVGKRMAELQRRHRETEAELGALLPSVLDQAFRGEL